MIDIKILRSNPEIVAQALVNKGITGVDLEEVIMLDKKRLKLWQEVEGLRARRNEISSLMGNQKPAQALIDEAKSIKDKLSILEKEFDEIETNFSVLFKKIPNIPTADTPIGHTEEENVVVKQWGSIPSFDFTPKNHYEIAKEKDRIDKERAWNVSWARFAYLKWNLVKLQLALMTRVIDTLSDQTVLQWIIDEYKLAVSSKPFTPIFPPYMIKTAPYDAMDRLEPRDERYKIEGQDLWLQGSAEHVLGSMHEKEIFAEEALPVRYIWYATSFRKEAGATGKDMEGIIRMHQFDKLEMESFSTAETSHDEHLLFSAIQEYLMQQLQLPYQKLQKCTFDIGKPNAKGSDIEARLPGQGKYRETHTADYMTDYQSRRLQTRVRRTNGDLELVHTNDATAFACGRALVAIIENYQTAAGDVIIPEVLRKWMGVEKI